MSDSRPPAPRSSATSPRHRVRVRYVETDRMGVAHHSSYVAWFEEARTEWLREQGLSYRELEDSGVLLMVVELRCNYLRSVTYDDVIEIETRLVERGKASIGLAYDVFAEGSETRVAEGFTRLASVDRDGRMRRLPESLPFVPDAPAR
jgi:acyl-CoA thioester hydrolase